VRIAGRLSDTTLGDVLGSLARARVTGVVHLAETSGPTAGRMHGIYLTAGAVVAVESQAVVMPLGEILRQRGLLDGTGYRQLTLRLASSHKRTGDILVEERLISPQVLGAALRQQVRARLEALFRLPDAAVSFHVACPPAASTTAPLAASEYLPGKPRARDRGSAPTKRTRAAPLSRRVEALRVLGLGEGASVTEVTHAFRDLASRMHPDRYAASAEAERRTAERRFAQLSAAYHLLVG
jgi:DnaJ-domain-containing protein 1